MPELPEVETVARELRTVIRGKTISGLRVNDGRIVREPALTAFARRLRGRLIRDIFRRGKVLIFALFPDAYLTVHLRMTGQLIYPGGGANPRVRFLFSDGTSLDYRDQRRFGEMRLVDEWRSVAFLRTMGPEPLEVGLEGFREALRGKTGKIKPLLMDQRVIAGIGNIYAAEILFRSGVRPDRRAPRLSPRELETIYRQMKLTLREAIRSKGSSIENFVRLSGGRGGYVRHHKVYGRAGEPCVVCGRQVRRLECAGRGTCFCPGCQR